MHLCLFVLHECKWLAGREAAQKLAAKPHIISLTVWLARPKFRPMPRTETSEPASPFPCIVCSSREKTLPPELQWNKRSGNGAIGMIHWTTRSERNEPQETKA